LRSHTKAQKKQDEILSAARQLFLERGYDAVSLDDIVERAGGSKTTLYSYYGGKEGLFVAAIGRTCRDRLGPLVALEVEDMDPKAALNEIGRMVLLTISKPEARAVFRTVISESQRFPELAATFFAAGPEATIQILRKNIERWQRKGLLRSGNSEMLAIQFLGVMMGNFHLKSLIGLLEPLSEKQIKAWVARGVNVFLEGALAE
jgi:AcrR family transcriptional regulator